MTKITHNITKKISHNFFQCEIKFNKIIRAKHIYIYILLKIYFKSSGGLCPNSTKVDPPLDVMPFSAEDNIFMPIAGNEKVIWKIGIQYEFIFYSNSVRESQILSLCSLSLVIRHKTLFFYNNNNLQYENRSTKMVQIRSSGYFITMISAFCSLNTQSRLS